MRVLAPWAQSIAMPLLEASGRGRLDVKALVAGTNIGTIAVGVAKAGARVIHIAGGDGGTGAGPLTSMRHAGLPWELGLVEVHRVLCEHGLRDRVTLRIDGGLASARDIMLAALLGWPQVSMALYVLVALIWLVPDRRMERALRGE